MGDVNPNMFDEDLSPTRRQPPTAFPAQGAPGAALLPGMFEQDLTAPVRPPPLPQPVDSRPWLTRANETAGDTLRAFTNAVTLGQMDRMAGGMNYLTGRGGAPSSYDEAVNQQVGLTEQAEKRSPYATLGGAMAGGVALPAFGAEALAARWGNTALNSAKQAAAARAAAYGTVGGGIGAVQGAGNTYTGNLADYAQNALIGGALGGVTGGTLGSALGPRPRVSAAKTPTTAETGAATNFGYDKLRANQAVYENPYLATEADRLERELRAKGASPRTNPTSFDVLNDMRTSTATPGGGNTPAELEAMRARINEISAHPDSAFDRKTGRVIKNAIDDFYKNPPLGAVRVGTEAEAATAGEVAEMSRKLAQSGYHQKTFDKILHDANLASGRPGGSASYPDLVWQGVKGLEVAPRPGAMPKLAGYNDAEQEALKKIAYPSWLQRGLRSGSELLGGGSHGLINPYTLAAGGAGAGGAAATYLGADPATGGVLGAIAPLTGLAMRGASGRMANKAIRDAYETIHQSNPLYDYRVMTSGTKSGGGLPASVSDASRNAIALQLVQQAQPKRLEIDTTDWGKQEQ